MKIFLRIAALLLTPALAQAAPPPQIQSGLWRFDYRSSVAMSGQQLPAQASSAQRCLTGTGPGKLPLMPKLPPNVHCTAPQMQGSSASYKVRLSCTADAPNGMVIATNGDFLITPSLRGDTMRFHGILQERIAGGPIPLPPALVTITADGRRIGACQSAR